MREGPTPKAMIKRMSHPKSRNGCQNCKKRHVKCDELGPPCANCAVRQLSCVYAGRPAGQAAIFDKTIPPKNLSTPAEEDAARARRLLELELMHRWSTSTWKSFYSMPEEEDYYQHQFARDALEYSFLLDGIFAISALDMIMRSGERGVYLEATLEYSERSSSAFREQLSAVTPKNHHLLYVYSVITIALNLAVPECLAEKSSMLERVSQLAKLLRGTLDIALMDWNALMDSPLGLRAFYELVKTSSLDYMSDSEKQILKSLESVNEQINPADEECQTATSTKLPQSTYNDIIRTLKLCFAEDSRGIVKGLALSILNYPGLDFAVAVERSDPMVLLLLMFWAVLMERVSKDMWWLAPVGKSLIREISITMKNSSVSAIPEGQECISWTRKEVGLEVE